MKQFFLLFLLLILLIKVHSQIPNLVWAKNMGGSYHDVPWNSTTDAAGNTLATGTFWDTSDFDPGNGVYNLTSAGGRDIYISKLNSAGDFGWAKRMGGSEFDEGFAITTDESENVITVGYFGGTVDFDPGAGVYNLTATAYQDVFISKLDSSGNFIWAKRIGGTDASDGRCLITDSQGNVYIGGNFSGTVDFDPDNGEYNLTCAGLPDGFVCKLDSAGNFVWAKLFSGDGEDYVWSLLRDASGNLFVQGYFSGTADFDPDTAGTYNLTALGDEDLFLCKLDTTADFSWVKQVSGTLTVLAYSMCFGNEGSIIISGSFFGSTDFDPGPDTFNLIEDGWYDDFVLKLDASGNFVWVKQIGGYSNADAAATLGMISDDENNIYLTGTFSGTVDFDPDSSSVLNLTASGYRDIFVVKLDHSGNLTWVITLGGPDDDEGRSISKDAAGNLYVAGWFYETVDFDPGAGIYNLTSAGSEDICIFKLSETPLNVQGKDFYGAMSVYPNPFSVHFLIDLGRNYTDVSLVISDVAGHEVSTSAFHNVNELSITCDVPPGIYFAEIKTSTGTSAIKIVRAF